MDVNLAVSLQAPPPVAIPLSGHQIALDSPKAVVDAVREVAQARMVLPAEREGASATPAPRAP